MLLRFPIHNDALSLTGSAVGPERLTVAIFMHRTFAHVRHTGPVRKVKKKKTIERFLLSLTGHTNARYSTCSEIASVRQVS